MSVMKYCPDCGEEQGWRAFARNRCAHDGLQAYCRTHQNARQCASRARHRETYRVINRERMRALRARDRALSLALTQRGAWTR